MMGDAEFSLILLLMARWQRRPVQWNSFLILRYQFVSGVKINLEYEGKLIFDSYFFCVHLHVVLRK